MGIFKGFLFVFAFVALHLAFGSAVFATVAVVNRENNATFTITPPAAGTFEIHITYRNPPTQLLPTSLTMTVNGEILAPEHRRLQFESLWQAVPPNIDRYGNEIPAVPISSRELLTKPLEDSTHMISVPLTFDFSQSAYTLEFSANDGEIEIHNVELRPQTQIPPYAGGSANGDFMAIIEAEQFLTANSPSIRAAGEYNPLLYPYNPARRLLNILDGASFASKGDRVDWEISVPTAGWYHIAFGYRQESDFPVFADILINGVPPSTAAKSVAFPRATNFTRMTVPINAESTENQTFWLESGTNQISLVLRGDPLREVSEELQALLNEMTEFRTEITRLTGGTTLDIHRDFRLDEFIPDVAGTLTNWADRSQIALNSTMQHTDGNLSSVFAGLRVAETNLRSLAERPIDVPRRLSELSGAPYSVTRFLAQSLQDMDNNAISIDRIYVFQSNAEFPQRMGLFGRFVEAIRRFFLSFTRREFEAGRPTEAESLQVWMSRPRPFVELLQSMVDAEFTAQTGIRVDVSIMPDIGRFALAAAAGNAPDVGLSVPYVLPSYLNIRGALWDMKDFANFYDVAERFPPGLFVPGIVEGGVFALPETINFWVMFYRSDIFEQLDLPVPDSLDEVLMILPELQRRSMNFFYPTAGMVGLNVFPATIPFILQSGGGFFGDTIGPSLLDSPASLEGFQILTDLFTVFDMPVEVPAPGFYQEFRAGTLPIGISDVGTYMLLANAAPELEGHWNIAPFPGIRQADGTVNRHTTGGDSSSIIFSTTDYPQAAWQFLDWWSSDDVQAAYGTSLMALHGGTFMWNSANRAAFAQLPIQGNHREVILQQTEYMVEVPWVPGTYMVERELSNAFNAVIINGINVRRAMDTAIKRIDREVERKLEEFGFTQNGVEVRPFITPSEAVLHRRND